MGIDIDGLGNHNFDRSADLHASRQRIPPESGLPVVSANIVDDNGNTPPEWSPSNVFKFPQGVEIGIVGFSNDEIVAHEAGQRSSRSRCELVGGGQRGGGEAREEDRRDRRDRPSGCDRRHANRTRPGR